MKNWIDYLLKANKKYSENPKKRAGYYDYFVKNSLWQNNGDYDLLKVEFYTKDKEGALQILEDSLWSKKFALNEAKRKLEEAQQRACKMLELCEVIETDIGIVEDEIEEINLLIAKNYPNEKKQS